MNLPYPLLLTLLSITWSTWSTAQVTFDTKDDADSTIRKTVLQALENEQKLKSNELSNRIAELDSMIKVIDTRLEAENDKSRRVSSLLQRVEVLEKKQEVVRERQEAVSDREILVYQRNYQSAIVNLIFMERELKPLILFNSTRAFFTALNQVSNPVNYDGFSSWFQVFSKHVKQQASEKPGMRILNNMLSFTKNLTQGTPLAGPLSSVLFNGINDFIGSLRRRDTKLKKQSLEMYELLVLLGQFSHDKGLIETEWDSIDKELDELRNIYQQTLHKNLNILGVDSVSFTRSFITEANPNERLNYATELKTKAAKAVNTQRENSKEKWKNTFYHEMQEVQSLRLRFGQLTFRIMENIEKYRDLIQKYKDQKLMKDNLERLSDKLDALEQAFDETFNPQEYIKSAVRMYIVP